MKVALLTTDNREHYKAYDDPVPHFGAAPEALIQGFARMPELEIHVVSCTQQAMDSPAKLAQNIWFHSLHVSKIGWMRTLYQGCIRAVRKTLEAVQPDIVHGQGTERDCAISAVLSGYPNVLTIHGNMAELARLFNFRPPSFGWLAARLENFTLPRTVGVFCNSEYTEGLVRHRAKRTWRVPNAIREPFFRPVVGDPARPRCLLVNVGVITPRKRQVELLDVAQQLHEQGLDFEWQFIGQVSTSPYGRAFLERIKPMEQAGYARYLGMKSVSELIEVFDRSAALIHFPSEEAFGLVVAEALARGLKLFGIRAGGVADIAEGIRDAELFSVDDWKGLTVGISEWMHEGWPRAKSGSDVMRARYHPDVIARRHLEIYREVLSTVS